MSGEKINKDGTGTAADFALMLETACRDFEAFLKMIRGDVWVQGRNQVDGPLVSSVVNMALTKSFVFHVIRAGRICKHGKSELSLDRLERKRFNDITDRILLVRNVNEHGFDRHRKGGSDISRPSIYMHDDLSVALDETSLIVLSENQVLMGPINLRDIYDKIKPFQVQFGFLSLQSIDSS